MNATAIAVEESLVFGKKPGSLVVCVLLLRYMNIARKKF